MTKTPFLTTVICFLIILSPCLMKAAPETTASPASSSSGAFAEYKVLSGFKQPFNDALQYHLSKGWQPVGGVAVTTWSNDLYFAQLIGRPAGVSQ